MTCAIGSQINLLISKCIMRSLPSPGDCCSWRTQRVLGRSLGRTQRAEFRESSERVQIYSGRVQGEVLKELMDKLIHGNVIKHLCPRLQCLISRFLILEPTNQPYFSNNYLYSNTLFTLISLAPVQKKSSVMSRDWWGLVLYRERCPLARVSSKKANNHQQAPISRTMLATGTVRA